MCLCHRHAEEVSAVPSVFFSSSGSDVDCVGRGLALLPFSVVEYHVVRKVAWGGPGGGLPNSFNPAIGNVFGTCIGLYDLVKDIPDVMGLRALRPSAAIVKVMSVPDSRCVSVVTPDDPVNIGLHEVLIHDLEDEELLFVTLSELGCLRLDWPKTLFTFMPRYQFDLDQMRKDCRERFGSTQLGNCTHCGKHIQQNLGKHIALYHMELAQLWRCPVTWCTVWKGTA